ncbi:lysosome-associated membrane glycoprotein 1b [Syngnathus acus]|uniref:lysosome-associated membrane glycoprotein 1b n=1 Tax=Syngnathus acus TaxID=161584 RepID=UPI00188639F2|nr:lysosome-associated membrane glycoprotein 1b [Syngnathus acus]XP_037096218.1 lysosome-associated membrane glycoprotein 1b [Syngnathus acus]
MTTTGGVHTRWLTFTLHLVLAAIAAHQGLATVAPSTEAPHKEPGRPLTGHYQVTGTNGSVCLLAYMGLQLNITFNSTSSNQTVHVVNLEPNATKASGSCDSDSAMLRLLTDANTTNLTFFFMLNATSNKYHLSGISLSADWPDMKGPFSARNNSLDYLRGTLGFSYMCHEEQTLNVDQALSINTFQLQVQPFNLTQNKFGTAEHCQLDEDDMLIAIVVGAALAGLVLIVLVAYLIGRRRSHAGYQSI